MDPVITGAIIASISSAALTTVQELTNDSTYIGGVVVNKTNSSFTLNVSQPMHGHWVHSNASDLLSVKELYELIEQSGLHSKDEIEQYAKKLLLGQRLNDHIREFTGTGDNLGFESLVIFRDKASSHKIATFIKKLPGGSYTAGASMTNDNWKYTGVVNTHKLMDYIKSCDSEICKLSKGNSVSIKLNHLEVKFAAAEVTEFIITDDRMPQS